MAINFLGNITLLKNQLLQTAIENQPSDSDVGANPVAGQIYFNTTDDVLKVYTGSAWAAVGSTETYTLPVSAGTTVANHTVADIDLTAAGASTGIKSKVTFAGKNSNIAISETTGNNGVVFVALSDSVTIQSNLEVGGEILQTSSGNENSFASPIKMNSQAIQDLLDPLNAQDAATKKYVDDNIAGGLIYQGGYNASTNSPDLDSNINIAVNKGWTYTVTVAGLFFTEQVRVGDVLISEIDQAAGAGALANWTTVQNNIDLASATQVGIGNVKASTQDEGIGLDVSYSAGTATVGLDIGGLSPQAAANLPDPGDILIPYLADTASKNHATPLSTLMFHATDSFSKTGSIAANATTGTVSHTFGINTMVQTIDSTGATVYCDITRTTTSSTATVNVAQSTAITILVSKIG